MFKKILLKRNHTSRTRLNEWLRASIVADHLLIIFYYRIPPLVVHESLAWLTVTHTTPEINKKPFQKHFLNETNHLNSKYQNYLLI
jgi:hypothetical protein